MMSWTCIGPKIRESSESVRLSPITNTSFAGMVKSMVPVVIGMTLPYGITLSGSKPLGCCLLYMVTTSLLITI
jgi:hypothetical protein